MRFSVIIASLNGADALPTCLAALARTDWPDFETIVVDNGSTDATARVARECCPEARLVLSDVNLGFAGGANLGMRVADGDAFVLLNDDTQVEPGWLAAFADAAERLPDWGVLGARLLYPDGTIQSAGADISLNALTSHVGCGELDAPSAYADVAAQPYVCGAAICIRRETAEALGRLDTNYFPIYFEEVDFCARARRRGYGSYYVPGARVVHHESRTTVARSYGYYLKYHKNRLRFVLRNFGARELARFVRAEARWLRVHRPRDVYRPLAHAYLLTALNLPGILLSRRK